MIAASIASAVALTCLTFPLAFADEAADTSGGKRHWHKVFSPTQDLFPRYVADPRRPRFAVVRIGFPDTEIDGAGDRRFALTVGGRYGLFRFHPEGAPDRGVQIDVEGAIAAQFDLTSSQDNIGWDGFYGIQVAWAPARGPVLRLGLFHDSAHIGDEFIEETGRERIDYTRQEVLLGVSHALGTHWRIYGEVGWGFDLRNQALQEPWRGQYGLEYESPIVMGETWNWYAALDVNHYEENDWNGAFTIQTGLHLSAEEVGRSYRFGVEYYDGRSRMGEFSFEDERQIGVGFWLDL